MVIGELLPFYGYFSRLLSDVVGPNGKIYGIENFNWSNTPFDKKLTGQRRNIILKRSKWGEFDLPEKLDLFWITQNYHDLHVPEYGKVDIAAFNRRVWDALKPGGIYMVVDQAGNPGMTDQQISDLHRIGKEQVIAEVTAAGFVLIDESKALYHPRDDRTKSVFAASVRGQTDQFMLKFQKPADAEADFRFARARMKMHCHPRMREANHRVDGTRASRRAGLHRGATAPRSAFAMRLSAWDTP